MFRAKCRWVQNGEYFFNLEKRNYNKKTILGELRLLDDSITNDEKLILNHIEAYYKDLHQKTLLAILMMCMTILSKI